MASERGHADAATIADAGADIFVSPQSPSFVNNLFRPASGRMAWHAIEVES
ncbi:hypothetical protein [Microbacterium azadirachtae]|uniref:hypothetical protein n=1 Tax=Microbacterium azadirachtae TaxID=582680 RepID=UPI000AE3A892|nr:hypothetical protein [Microbacterium azadirachtae]